MIVRLLACMLLPWSVAVAQEIVGDPLPADSFPVVAGEVAALENVRDYVVFDVLFLDVSNTKLFAPSIDKCSHYF